MATNNYARKLFISLSVPFDVPLKRKSVEDSFSNKTQENLNESMPHKKRVIDSAIIQG